MYKRIVLVFLALSALFSMPSFAQGGDMTIDGARQKAVIDSVGWLLNNNYIYPEVAKKMADHLQENYKKGTYNTITNGVTFAGQITTDLQSISKDKHLKVLFNPNAAAQMK